MGIDGLGDKRIGGKASETGRQTDWGMRGLGNKLIGASGRKTAAEQELFCKMDVGRAGNKPQSVKGYDASLMLGGLKNDSG